MKNLAMWALRIGLSITFIWIGYLVLQNPGGWAKSIQPWAVQLMPVMPENMMVLTGYFDIAVGIMLLINPMVGIAALLGTVHLAGVVLTISSSGIIARDLGLLGAALALTIETFPWAPVDKFFHRIGRG